MKRLFWPIVSDIKRTGSAAVSFDVSSSFVFYTAKQIYSYIIDSAQKENRISFLLARSKKKDENSTHAAVRHNISSSCPNVLAPCFPLVLSESKWFKKPIIINLLNRTLSAAGFHPFFSLSLSNIITIYWFFFALSGSRRIWTNKKRGKKMIDFSHPFFFLFWLPLEFCSHSAVHGSDQSVGHFERSEANGCGRTVAGLPSTGILRAERSWEDGRLTRHAFHGPGQDHQAVVAMFLHRIRSIASLWGHWSPLSGTRCK